ncbi:MAG: phosphoribosyltransferase [Lysobacteraceae bacterium]
MNALPFLDRESAGHALAAALASHAGAGALVLAIPRGGVPVGRVVADRLHADLDVVLVRKIGAPGNPEFAIGAVDEQGHVHLERHAARSGADGAYVEERAAAEGARIRQRRERYGHGRPPTPVAGRTGIVGDDGLATGATRAAALKAVRAGKPAHLVCAVPVAARDSLATVAPHADAGVCLATPSPFEAVGLHYLRFPQVSDDEVVALLARR